MNTLLLFQILHIYKHGTIPKLSKTVRLEPNIALDGGEDGLKFYKILVEQANKFLKPNGYLCMEIGYNQKEPVEELLRKPNKYENIETIKDLSGNYRVVVAQKREETKCLFQQKLRKN